MPSFKPAYLIHGDNHGRIAERRARLRSLAESGSGAEGIEVFEGETAEPDSVAGALNAMTFAMGRRFIIVDGVERWKDRDLDALEAALAEMPPDTTVAFFAREEGRQKAPPRLHDAVRQASGQIDAEENVKPWELPKWIIEQARQVGLQMDVEAARALIALVGDRQQRLLRELEKLVLTHGAGARLDRSMVEEQAAPSAELRAWSLADALVSGDAKGAASMYLALRAQGERLSGLIYWMASRVRQALQVAQALDSGQPVAQVKRTLRMPSRAADRLIADARSSGVDGLRRAIEEIADLELASRGGSKGMAGEDTVALEAIQRISG
ncbi:MAG: DNA polymerase III subunit delta [Solirubrobacteraceae bacterium]